MATRKTEFKPVVDTILLFVLKTCYMSSALTTNLQEQWENFFKSLNVFINFPFITSKKDEHDNNATIFYGQHNNLTALCHWIIKQKLTMLSVSFSVILWS